MQHHKSQIYQRKNRKGEKGVWYYRKRIPADVLGIWKVNGRSIKEYNASLGTTDKREAERRAVKEHSKFLNILEIKRQESRVVLSESQERIQTHYKYEDTLRRLGAHPEQAPPVNAPSEVIQQYQDAVDLVKYGVLTAGTDGTQEWSGGLVDLQVNVGIDQSFDADEELEIFLREYLPRMGEELQLITLICEHAGCRIGDATGILLGDCRLKTDDTRPIPSLKIHSNHIRQVTKGGIEREIPLFGSVYERLCNFTHGRKGPEEPLFPTYGKSRGAGNASAAINKHIHDLRGADVRLTFHSFRHTVQSKAMAATDMPNKFPAYIGGWNNGDAKGLQAEYQTGGIPIGVLYEALKTIHDVKIWGREENNPHQDEWA